MGPRWRPDRPCAVTRDYSRTWSRSRSTAHAHASCEARRGETSLRFDALQCAGYMMRTGPEDATSTFAESGYWGGTGHPGVRRLRLRSESAGQNTSGWSRGLAMGSGKASCWLQQPGNRPVAQLAAWNGLPRCEGQFSKTKLWWWLSVPPAPDWRFTSALGCCKSERLISVNPI